MIDILLLYCYYIQEFFWLFFMDFGLNLPVATEPPNVTWLHMSSSNDHPDAWCDCCCNYCGYSNDDHCIANSAKCKFFLSTTYHLCVCCIEIIPLASLPGKSSIWGVCGHHKHHSDGWFGQHYFWVAVMVYEMKTSQNADEESRRAQKKKQDNSGANMPLNTITTGIDRL